MQKYEHFFLDECAEKNRSHSLSSIKFWTKFDFLTLLNYKNKNWELINVYIYFKTKLKPLPIALLGNNFNSRINSDFT